MGKRLQKSAGLLLAALLLLGSPAGPARGEVAFRDPAGPPGGVTVDQAGATTTITTTADLTILELERLGVELGETLIFDQPNVSSAVLNRILGADPSQLLGTLMSNGHVYVVNPAGVFIGADAVIDAAGFQAAAGDLTDEQFLAREDSYTNLRGDVSNHGQITADVVKLVGRTVANSGVIQSSSGDGVFALVVGRDVFIGSRDTGGRVLVRIEGAFNDLVVGHPVSNTGLLDAGPRGSVHLGSGDLLSMAILQTGTIRAQVARLDAGAGGGVDLAGTIDVSAAEAPDLARIEVFGKRIDVGHTATSEETGLGVILRTPETGNGEIVLEAIEGITVREASELALSLGPGTATVSAGDEFEVLGNIELRGDLSVSAGSVRVAASVDSGTRTVDDPENEGETIEENLLVALSLEAVEEISLEGPLLRAETVGVHAGTGGVGDLSVDGDLVGDVIQLRAGDGAPDEDGGAGSQVLIGDVAVRGFTPTEEGGDSSPRALEIRQDAAVVDATLPDATALGAGTQGVAYRVISDQGTIAIQTASKVEGSLLTLSAAEASAGAEIVLAEEGSVFELEALELGGDTEIRGGLELSGGLTADGDVVAADDITIFGATSLNGEGDQLLQAGSDGTGTLVADRVTKTVGHKLTILAGEGAVMRFSGDVTNKSVETETIADEVIQLGAIEIQGQLVTTAVDDGTNLSATIGASGDIDLSGASLRLEGEGDQSIRSGFGGLVIAGDLVKGVAGAEDDPVQFGGNLSLNAITGVRVKGDVRTAAGDLVLRSDAVIDGAVSVSGVINAEANLTVSSPGRSDGLVAGGDATIGGDLDVSGDTEVGGDLDVTGDSDIGGSLEVSGGLTAVGDVVAADDITIFGATSLDGEGDQLLQAGSDGSGTLIADRVTKTAGHKLTILAGEGAVMRFSGPVINLSSETETIADEIIQLGTLEIRGELVTTAVDDGSNLSVALGASGEVDLSEAKVRLEGRGNQRLFTTDGALNIGSDLLKGGALGEEDGEFEFGGDLTLDAIAIAVDGDIQVLDGRLDIRGDYTIDGDLSASERLEVRGNGSLTGLNDQGGRELKSDRGGMLIDGTLNMVEVGELKLGAAGRIDVSAEISVGDPESEAVPAGGRILVLAPLDIAQDSSLSVHDGTIALGAVASDTLAGSPTANLTVDVGGGLAYFAGDVVMSDESTLEVSSTAGAGDVGQGIRFGPDVENVTAGSIHLNAAGRGPASSATIAKLGIGDLSFSATDGEFEMGAGEKLTVAGGLEISATSRAVLGDLAALEIDVSAPQIVINARPGAAVELPDGSMRVDDGVDFVANRIAFSSTPTLKGGGPVSFGTPSGVAVNDAITESKVAILRRAVNGTPLVAQDLLRPLQGATPFTDPLTGEVLPFQGRVLDLAASGPMWGDPSAEADVEWAPVSFRAEPLLSGANLASVSAKPPWAAELVRFLECAAATRDDRCTDPGSLDSPSPLRSEAALRAVAFYTEVFGAGPETDWRTGEVTESARLIDARASLQSLVDALLAESDGSTVSGAELAGYLSETTAHPEARRQLQRLADLFDAMEHIQMPQAEITAAQRRLLAALSLQGLSPEELTDTLESFR